MPQRWGLGLRLDSHSPVKKVDSDGKLVDFATKKGGFSRNENIE